MHTHTFWNGGLPYPHFLTYQKKKTSAELIQLIYFGHFGVTTVFLVFHYYPGDGLYACVM